MIFKTQNFKAYINFCFCFKYRLAHHNQGLVTQTSYIIPQMRELREALFLCSVCINELLLNFDRGHITESNQCTNCNTNYCFQIIHNRSGFTDKQMIKLIKTKSNFKVFLLLQFLKKIQSHRLP